MIPTDKQFRIAIIFFLTIATCLVIVSAFDDLYHPGSTTAKQYADIATGLMIVTVLLSVPLWYKKIRAIEDWMTQMNNIDKGVRIKAIWQAIKPLITTIIIALILTVILSGIIYYFNIIPTEVIDRYKSYYTPINYSNLSIIDYPNTSILYP